MLLGRPTLRRVKLWGLRSGQGVLAQLQEGEPPHCPGLLQGSSSLSGQQLASETTAHQGEGTNATSQLILYSLPRTPPLLGLPFERFPGGTGGIVIALQTLHLPRRGHTDHPLGNMIISPSLSSKAKQRARLPYAGTGAQPWT